MKQAPPPSGGGAFRAAGVNMDRLWELLKKIVCYAGRILRRVPIEGWCRLAVVGVVLLETAILLSSSNVPPTDLGEVFGEIHWYGEG